MTVLQDSSFKEVLIANNPSAYQELDRSIFERLIVDGTWIALVFTSVKNVVERHFFELCDLNWDYIRDLHNAPENYERYKTIYYTGLDPEQVQFIHAVADQIEEEILQVANATLDARNTSENE